MSQNYKRASDRPYTILVMDDEDYIRSLLKNILEKLNHSVELTSDGQEAVSRYKSLFDKESPADLVILDLTVPEGMGGQEAAQQILAIDPTAKIAVSSGNFNDPMMLDFESFGLAGSLPKPFRLSEIQQVIQRMVEN